MFVIKCACSQSSTPKANKFAQVLIQAGLAELATNPEIEMTWEEFGACDAKDFDDFIPKIRPIKNRGIFRRVLRQAQEEATQTMSRPAYRSGFFKAEMQLNDRPASGVGPEPTQKKDLPTHVTPLL